MSSFFKLARRGRQPFDENRPTVKDLNEMENRIMGALEDAVASLNEAIQNANSRFQNVGSLESAIAEERAKYDALVAAEEAEDVQQNQELADVRAQTDAALAEIQAAAQSIQQATEQVNTLGSTVAQESGGETAPSAPDSGQVTTEPPAGAEGTETPTETPTDQTVSADEAADQSATAPTEGETATETQSGEPDDPQSTANMNPNV